MMIIIIYYVDYLTVVILCYYLFIITGLLLMEEKCYEEYLKLIMKEEMNVIKKYLYKSCYKCVRNATKGMIYAAVNYIGPSEYSSYLPLNDLQQSISFEESHFTATPSFQILPSNVISSLLFPFILSFPLSPSSFPFHFIIKTN